MSAVVVYLDHEHAKVFRLTPGKVDSQEFRSHEHHGHREPQGKHGHSHAGSEKFFHELATKVSDASELLIVGHGLAKEHFKHHLDSHHAALSTKVVGVETVDHPTDNQVLAKARLFFKQHDLFS